MILIADSGSTKTAWCLLHEHHAKLIMTQGINPFQLDEADMAAVIQKELLPQLEMYGQSIQLDDIVERIGEIFFYGAGCTKEKAPVVATAIRTVMNNKARINVLSDMLGAARALCADRPGIVCILGTGSNSCYYDGEEIVDNVSPLGFILGDEGSGAYMGKRLVGNCLKRQFSEETCMLFEQETKLDPQTIIQKVYREPMPSRFLASLSPFCARHRDIPEIHDFIIDCFTQFFMRNVNLYNCPELPVCFTGSVAWFYQNELRETADKLGFKMGEVLQAPMAGLIKYHA
jgi:N-acetylglucosamine kinase-like BadF-type ATPase